MGPSGAGKTTLLNVLSGKASYGRVTGSIFLNDDEASVHGYSAFVGFVSDMERSYLIRERYT